MAQFGNLLKGIAGRSSEEDPENLEDNSSFRIGASITFRCANPWPNKTRLTLFIDSFTLGMIMGSSDI